jgi:hypothetical protein
MLTEDLNNTRQQMKEFSIRMFWKIANEGLEIRLDGTKGYNDRAQFVAGKVINFCSYVLVNFFEGTDDFDEALLQCKKIIRMVHQMEMETWGIFNSLIGLRRLQNAGLLEEVLEPDVEETLRKSLDWRSFVNVNENYALINKPTNYYGVAVGIARYRYLLRWEDQSSSEILLQHLMNHIEEFSASGYMDETKGEGRFDRYSVLIPAEIVTILLDTGAEVPELLKDLLRKCSTIMLAHYNEKGSGFAYGRSIGAYGETAPLQVLSTAAVCGGILQDCDLALAYDYCVRLIQFTFDFWYDDAMDSINFWEHGRRTDGYRNKNRILGENLSILLQIYEAMEQWEKAEINREFQTRPDKSILDDFYHFSFSDGEYPRSLIVYRSPEHVWALPIINGGRMYYDKDAYLPVPRANFLLEPVPDITHLAYIPRIRLLSGNKQKIVYPSSYCSDIEVEDKGDSKLVHLNYRELCILDGNSPSPFSGISIETTYVFRQNSVQRIDKIRQEGPLQANVKFDKIFMDIESYSKKCRSKGFGKFSFAEGTMQEIELIGYDTMLPCDVSEHYLYEHSANQTDYSYGEVENVVEHESFSTPHGPLGTVIRCEKSIENWEIGQELELSWKLMFND